MSNPFKEQFVVMKFPEGSSGTMAMAGFNLEADEHGCIDIPQQFVKEAESHGLFRTNRPEPKAKGK